MRNQKKIWIAAATLLLSAVMASTIVFRALPLSVTAASSAALQSQLEDLQSEADAIAAEAERLQQEMAENQSETQSIVDRKSNIDQKLELTRQQVENLNQQIQQYNLLIAEKQAELDEATERETALNEQYKLRLRAMEESGSVSYWSVLFHASSFTDLLDRLDMIQEIAEADRTMLRELQQAADEIVAARTEVEQGRTQLQEAKDELAVLETQLAEERAEADEILVELASNQKELEASGAMYEQLEAEVRQQITETQAAYEAALADEEAQRQIEAARQEAASGSISTPSSPSSSGFIYPLGASGFVTDAYGYRYHPIYGDYKFHPAVDFAVPQGTPIYATKSGTVTAATYNEYNGYYVAINHNDGYTSLYAHMTNFVVSVGQTVSQGEVIGYVGSTGYSTGPHMHFEITYGGASVNPMEYVTIP